MTLGKLQEEEVHKVKSYSAIKLRFSNLKTVWFKIWGLYHIPT